MQWSTTLSRHLHQQAQYSIFVPELDYTRNIVRIHFSKISSLDSYVKVFKQVSESSQLKGLTQLKLYSVLLKASVLEIPSEANSY